MQAEQVAYAKSQGVTMGSIAHGSVIGWTTDEEKAAACREQGLRVTRGYNRTGPPGWEIVAAPDPPPEEEEAA